VIDHELLFSDLAEVGLEAWRGSLQDLLNIRFAKEAHGDLPRWRSAIDGLPEPPDVTIDLDTAWTGGNCPTLSTEQSAAIREQLLLLRPWRKGPFNLCGVKIDAEWRSDLKWARIENAISPLAGRTVLDVGCGNGYYALRMAGAGAKLVVGVDPTLLFVCQFLAVRKLLQLKRVHVLPARLHELPIPAPVFDSTFSMGVLYHQRRPDEHLAQLRSTLRPHGELILETLILPGDDHSVLEPEDRYARMRNVWHLPTVPSLTRWLQDAGFENIRVADISITSSEEQRATEWMPFESLAEALDKHDPLLTIEGLPAPTRAVVICDAAG